LTKTIHIQIHITPINKSGETHVQTDYHVTKYRFVDFHVVIQTIATYPNILCFV